MRLFPDLKSLMPHSGTMRLLDTVREFNHHRIVCEASSHRDPANPLRHRQQLSVQTGIEYAAQAIAAHGGLLAWQENGTSLPRAGMIAVMSDVHWYVDRLDTVTPDLVVSAEKLADLPQALNYRFELSANQQILIQGELIIALRNADAT